jgi:hypothetical protein
MRRGVKKGTKRGPYNRRTFIPKFGGGIKTTTKEGITIYMKDYTRKIRELDKKVKQND